jgi:hypothetical protein
LDVPVGVPLTNVVTYIPEDRAEQTLLEKGNRPQLLVENRYPPMRVDN